MFIALSLLTCLERGILQAIVIPVENQLEVWFLELFTARLSVARSSAPSDHCMAMHEMHVFGRAYACLKCSPSVGDLFVG